MLSVFVLVVGGECAAIYRDGDVGGKRIRRAISIWLLEMCTIKVNIVIFSQFLIDYPGHIVIIKTMSSCLI